MSGLVILPCFWFFCIPGQSFLQIFFKVSTRGLSRLIFAAWTHIVHSYEPLTLFAIAICIAAAIAHPHDQIRP